VKVHQSPVKVQWKSTGLLPDTLVCPLSWPKGSLTRLLLDFYQTLSRLSPDFHRTFTGLSPDSGRLSPDSLESGRTMWGSVKYCINYKTILRSLITLLKTDLNHCVDCVLHIRWGRVKISFLNKIDKCLFYRFFKHGLHETNHREG